MSSKTTPASPRRRKPANKGLRIDRRFTEAGKDPFASFTFVEREAMVRDFKTGEIKFQLAVEVPDDWDQGAVDVIASKYCRKAGVPQYDADGNQMFDDNGDPVLGPERSAKQVIGRMAAAWRLWGERGSYFASVDDAQAFEDEMAYMIMNQMGAPNSPQWFNTGLFEAYGLTEDAEGNSYWDPELGEIVHSAHKYERSAASACYISSVEDNLVGPGGIMEFAVNEARLFKGGSGSGANLSKIREKNAPLTAGGVSSGVMGFARGHDRFAGAIKCLDADTPVITSAGSVRIGDVRAGHEVLTRHGFRRVTAAHDNGRRPVVELVSEFGTKIVCTREHRFWVRTPSGEEGWREAGTIEPEDRIAFDLTGQPYGTATPLRLPEPGHHNEKPLSLPGAVSDDFGLWLGLHWGDGSMSRTPSSSSIAVQVGDDTPDLPAIYERLTRRVFGDNVHFVHARHTDRPDASVSIRFSSTLVLRFLELNNLRKPPCRDLHIPDVVKSATPTARASFLAGLFEADGSVENGYATLSTVSPQLAADVHAELLSLGIPSSIKVQTIRTGAFGQAPINKVRVIGGEGMHRFAKIVGFVSERKQNALDAALARKAASPFETQWIIPGVKGELTELWERHPHMRRAIAPYSKYTACRTMSLLRARALVERFPDEFVGTAVERFAGGTELWARVTVTDAGERPVADLTVDGVHEYLVGSAVTHNSGGTTRRAAKMVILDAEHPDIEEFVHCKVVEEKVARDLIAAGYDSGYDTPGGAYDIVSFQNANHSVRIPRGFMGLLNDDGDLELTSRRDGKVVKTISARQLWDDIAEAAWFSADPGVQFDGIINDWATTPNDGKIRGSNPCFTGDTLVHTDKGLVRFDDMARRAADGETFGVYTHDATNVEVPANKLVLSVADAVMITGVNDIVRLDFSNGAHLRCTPNHRIWTTNRGWVEAQHLTSVDVLLAATEPAGGVFESAHLVSRTDDGREVTYNLSEPRNHSYVANGVVVRNCSEYLHIDDTACNLASVNLGKFFDADRQTFDVDGYIHACRLWTVALEITVAMSHYPTENVARNSYEHRTLGLGFANLGALVMRAGLPYDSREARATMGAVVSIMNSTAYATSAEMAAAVGTCAAYDRNAAEMQRVLRNHRRAAYGTLAGDAGLDGYEHLEVTPVEIDHRVLGRTPFGALSAKIVAQADLMVEAVAAYGARNTQVTVSAPTGTISLQMSCDTSGPEPDFALIKWKKLAGGGYMKIVNQSVPAALRALGYDPATVDQIVTYALGTQTLASPCPINRESLSSAGVADDILDKIEAALPTSGDITMAMAAHVVGNDLYTEHGLDPNTDPAALLLTALGFSNDQIVASSKVMCGHETVEGAPGLRDEDLAVFDTANLCGDGTRFIAWEGHVTALGALQPHLSGGISKTINMPNTATVDDIRAAHELSYELGVKCVAVYRDGCKASQPLSNSIVDGATADDLNEDDPASALPLHAEIVPGMSPVEYYHGKVPLRFRLPKNRAARTFSFEIGGMDCYVTTGEYDDGSLGEIWLNVGRDGSTMRGAFAAFSIAMSLGLQRGVPLEHYVDKYLGHNFAPNGIVIHPNLKMASSIPDAIVRLLGWWYLGRDDLVQVPGEAHAPAVPAPRAAEPPAASTEVGAAAQVLQGGSPYTGDICPNCSSTRMVRSGTCATCADCSATTGCS